MCGICGVASADGRPGDPEILGAMSEAIRHRGSDGEGTYVAPGIGLAVRRLAIIDLQGGDQPISNEDGSLCVGLNGEIYNFRDLRTELEQQGHRFKTRTDTECIVHAYEEDGDECVQRLRGMFAFALWDGPRRRLLLARDRLGKKPIYYTVIDGQLYFCSELRGLLEGLPVRPEVDLQAIDLYLSLQYIPEPLTAYLGVCKLPAAHTLVWEAGRITIRRYWDFAYLPKHTDDEEVLAGELRSRLRDAVRKRLVSDVPLGAHLSGGIDSSVVVALMAELSEGPVKTFSVGFQEHGFSELPYARAVAQRYGTDHHEFALTYGDIPETLERIGRHFGEPMADASAIPLFHMSLMTRRHVTVALNGDGGDEDFAGYQRYSLDPYARLYSKLPALLTRRAVPWFVGQLRDRSELPTGQGLVNGLKRLEQLPGIDERASILRWGSYFTPAQRQALWKLEYWQRICADDAEAILVDWFNRGSGSFLDRTLYTDLHTYLPGDLLVKADRMTMAASLEGRSPFLDHEIVEWTARLPDSLKVRMGSRKYLLRKAFARDLPESVRSHRKQGFGIPLAAWFRGPLAHWSRELLLGSGSKLDTWLERAAVGRLLEEHAEARADHGKRLYALCMLALWMEDL